MILKGAACQNDNAGRETGRTPVSRSALLGIDHANGSVGHNGRQNLVDREADGRAFRLSGSHSLVDAGSERRQG